MITGELKSKVDRIWNTMWSGGISNPLSVIEQLTYLLFIKRLDELHTREEHRAARTGHPIAKPLFTARQGALRWSRFKELAPERMFETVRDRVFPFIKSLGQTGDSDEGSTYAHHMKDALFMMPTARVLANVVDQLDDIDMADSDTKGDLYEYMLGKIATAGQNGQFRTPRHIIRLMVDMTAPTPKDVICDPACGTAGFLVAASEHLVEHHGDRIYNNARARRRFNVGTFHGYDFDTTMLRIGSMNMLLHGVENPDIRYRDSLAQTDLAAAGDDAEPSRGAQELVDGAAGGEVVEPAEGSDDGLLDALSFAAILRDLEISIRADFLDADEHGVSPSLTPHILGEL